MTFMCTCVPNFDRLQKLKYFSLVDGRRGEREFQKSPFLELWWSKRLSIHTQTHTHTHIKKKQERETVCFMTQNTNMTNPIGEANVDKETELLNNNEVPLDAKIMALIVKSMGVEDYEPRVINLLLEFMHRMSH
jgi:hypothetical protein